MRESPSVELMDMMRNKGAIVSYSDPHVPVFPKLRKYSFDLKSVELTAELIRQFDAVLLATDHDAFDYQMLQQQANILVDTRGRYARVSANNIVSA